MATTANHQGIIAQAAPKPYAQIEDILALAQARSEEPMLLVLDGIEDPHNLGALIRSADGAGVHGVVIPKRRAVGLTATVSPRFCRSGGIYRCGTGNKSSPLSRSIER
jgi:23S rRNA (guanosine2251-2'-O)-methyltransferase